MGANGQCNKKNCTKENKIVILSKFFNLKWYLMIDGINDQELVPV